MSFVQTLAESLLVLRVDDSRVDPELEKATQKFKARMDAVSKIAEGVRNAAAIGLAAGVLMIKNVSDAYAESEAQQQRFRSTFQMLGADFEAQIPRATKWAEQLSKISDFDDDDLLEGLGNVTQVTGSVSDGMLAMEAATDLARLKGIELSDAQNLVTMAFNGQSRGLKKLIGDLGEGVSGHAALVEVQKRVAGGAESTADTVERAQQRMDLAWETAREKLGKDMQPTLIKLYGALGNLAGMLDNVNGVSVLWTTGILGGVAATAQAVKWTTELRVALATLAAAQRTANAEGAAAGGWLKGLPGLLNPATLAVLALAAAWAKAYKDMENYQAALGSNAGGDGTGGPYIMTERGLQTTKEISDETGMTPFEYGAAYVGGLVTATSPVGAGMRAIGIDPMQSFKDMKSAAQSAEDSNKSIQRLHEQQLNQLERLNRTMENTQRNQANGLSPKGSIDQQLATLI